MCFVRCPIDPCHEIDTEEIAYMLSGWADHDRSAREAESPQVNIYRFTQLVELSLSALVAYSVVSVEVSGVEIASVNIEPMALIFLI